VADPADEHPADQAESPTATRDPDGGDPPIAKNRKTASSTSEIEQRLDQAAESLNQATGAGVSTAAEPQPYQLGNLAPTAAAGGRQPIDLVGEVEMDLRIELGRTQMRLEEVLHLRGGSVVALDKLAGDPVDVFANGRLIARGEVLVMNDNFCIRVTELVGA
jgi:flagellar motor switch protein FliN/FliY